MGAKQKIIKEFITWQRLRMGAEQTYTKLTTVADGRRQTLTSWGWGQLRHTLTWQRLRMGAEQTNTRGTKTFFCKYITLFIQYTSKINYST